MRMLPLDQPANEADIYVIVSKISNEFFVGKTKAGNAYNAYKDHVRLRNKQTKKLFMQSEEQENFPQMFILETLESTEQMAYRHCIAWTKYFMDRGLTPLSTATMAGYAEDMLEDTKEIYERISGLSMEEVLCEENLRVKNYQKKDKAEAEKPKEQIVIYTTTEQYEKIAERAKKQNLNLSAFCKNAALEAQFITVEAPDYSEYIAEVRGAKVILRQILYAIYTNGKYYPADMENIQKAVDKICEQEEAFRDAWRQNTKVLMKLLPKQS